jgi:hypothetical protein
LSRSEFPYDIKRRIQEKNSEQPQPREDLFYDIEKNKFVKTEQYKKVVKPNPLFIPEPLLGSGIEKKNGLATAEPSQDKKEEGIIEFLYDIFDENENTEDPLTLPDETTPQ